MGSGSDIDIDIVTLHYVIILSKISKDVKFFLYMKQWNSGRDNTSIL